MSHVFKTFIFLSALFALFLLPAHFNTVSATANKTEKGMGDRGRISKNNQQWTRNDARHNKSSDNYSGNPTKSTKTSSSDETKTNFISYADDGYMGGYYAEDGSYHYS